MSQSWWNDVLAFSRKFGHTIGTTPAVPDAETVARRVRLINEEVGKELIPAIKANDLVGIADGCADAIYVIIGTAIAYGIDLPAVFDEVQRSNMSKSPRKDPGGKTIKGDSFSPADVAGVLSRQGPIGGGA